MAIASFFTVSIGGLTIGVIFGMLSALCTRVTSHVRSKWAEVVRIVKLSTLDIDNII